VYITCKPEVGLAENQQSERVRKKIVQPSHVLWLLLQRLQDVDFCFKGNPVKMPNMKITMRSVKIEFEV